MVIRLFCEHGSHFQWLRWGTVVKTELAGGDRQVIDLTEDVEGIGPAGYTGEEEEIEAENTIVVVEGEAKGTGKPKVGEDTDDDAVDVVAEEI